MRAPFDKMLVVLIAPLVLHSTCLALGAAPQQKNPALSSASKAYILILHGLNLKPSKMKAIAETACPPQSKRICEILSLAGHEEDQESTMASVTAEIWKKQVLESALRLSEKAEQENVPLILIGYSLGGLIGTWVHANWDAQLALNHRPHLFDAQILIAPAIATRWYTGITPFLPLPSAAFLPSKNHPDYRANAGTSLGAYRAMFRLIREVNESAKNKSDINVPTLVALHREDELVSPGGTEKWIQNHAWTNWKIFWVDHSTSKLKPSYNHLMIDETSLGAEPWEKLQFAIQSHLSQVTLFTEGNSAR